MNTNTQQPVLAVLKPNLSASSGHLDHIDGFRGLAILMVLLYHAWEGAHSPAAFWWNPLFSGYTGVNLFLVLSGFCLYWPLVRPGKPASEPSLADFARRRVHRLVPPYYIALAIFTVAALVWEARGGHWPEGPDGGATAILRTAGWHLLLVQNLRPEHIFTIDGPFWSLALEVSFYIAMPILVVLARKTRIEWAVVFAALVTLIYRLACDRLAGGAAGWIAGKPAENFVLINFLPGQWLEFALGMWAADLVARRKGGSRAQSFLMAALVSLAAAAWLSQQWTRYNPYSDILYGMGFFFLILQVSSAPAARNTRMQEWLNAAFRTSSLVWLGRISYSVYLIHNPLLKVSHVVMDQTMGKGLLNRDRLVFGEDLLIFIPIIGISYLFHLGCERPFMNGVRKQPALLPAVNGADSKVSGKITSAVSQPPDQEAQ